MDAASIITQLSRDDEELNVNEKDGVDELKSRHRNFFQSIFCCWRRQTKSNKNGPAVEESTTPPPLTDQQRYLLPPIRHSDMHKKCMVIDLDETLVHSSFKPIPNADFIVPVEIDGTIHQVYVLKRPYVDEFLKKMGELYECVLFTASLAKYADPVADLLDKWSVFRSRLFRDSCVYYRGNYIKDLNRLGRDLQKIVIVDNSPASYIFHPDNAVPVKSWFDDATDCELLELIPLFEKLSKVDSVYSVLCNSNSALGNINQESFLNSSPSSNYEKVTTTTTAANTTTATSAATQPAPASQQQLQQQYHHQQQSPPPPPPSSSSSSSAATTASSLTSPTTIATATATATPTTTIINRTIPATSSVLQSQQTTKSSLPQQNLVTQSQTQTQTQLRGNPPNQKNQKNNT